MTESNRPLGQSADEILEECASFDRYADANPFAAEVIKQIRTAIGDRKTRSLIGRDAELFENDMWLDVLLNDGMITTHTFQDFQLSLTPKGLKFADYLIAADSLGLTIE